MAYWLLFFLITGFALAYLRPGIRATSLALGLATLFYGLFGSSWWLFVVLAAAGAAVFLPLNLTVLREEWLSRPLFRGYRRVLGRLDDAQLSAIAAGTAGWDAELFGGTPDWTAFAERYVMRLSPDERSLIEGPVSEFCARFARDAGTPNAIARLRAYGLFGVGIGIEHGGKGYSAIAQAAVLGRLAAGAGSRPALAAGDLAHLRWADLLLRHGEPAQQSLWLPRFALGPIVQAADGRIAADAVVVLAEHSEPRLQLTLAAPLADDAEVLALRADVRDPDRLLPATQPTGPTLLLIEATALRSIEGPLQVGFDTVLGGRARIGRAALDYAESRAVAQAIAPAAIHAGTATALALAAGAAAPLRAPFESAGDGQAAAQEALAKLAAHAYAAQALAAASARAVDLGEKPVGPAAFARTLAVQLARRCHGAALDLGLERGGLRQLVAQLAARDDGDEAPLLARPDAYAACVLRSHAGFMGALGAADADTPAEAMQRFDAALWDAVGHFFATGARALALGLTAGSRLFAAGPVENRLRRRLNRYSAALAFASDVALGLLARELGSRQPYTALRGLREASRLSLTTWLGDALAQLYLASAALRQYEDGGFDPAERAVLELICGEAFTAVEEALDRVTRHLWSRPLAVLVRLITRPLGAAALAPDESIQRQVAHQVGGDGALRARLALRSGLPADASTWPLLEAALAAQHAGLRAEQKADEATAEAPPRFAPARIGLAESRGAIDAHEVQNLQDWLAAVGRFRAA